MADVTHANSPALVGTTVNVTASHEGVNCVPFSFVAGGVTVSASTIIFLAKIPAGAHITNLNMAGWIASAGNATVDVGLTGTGESADYFIDGAAISNTATADMAYGTSANKIRAGALPYFVSLSDDTQPRFKYLQAKLASITSAEVSCIIRGSVEYVMGRPKVT